MRPACISEDETSETPAGQRGPVPSGTGSTLSPGTGGAEIPTVTGWAGPSVRTSFLQVVRL